VESDDDENNIPLSELLKSRQRVNNYDVDEFLNWGDVPTEEVLSDENWEQELLDNYIANHDDAFDFQAIEEAQATVKEIAQKAKLVLKSKSEMRQSIDEMEYFLTEKNPSVLTAFRAFKTAFIESSNKAKTQRTITQFFN
jgi:hypothetical protein